MDTLTDSIKGLNASVDYLAKFAEKLPLDKCDTTDDFALFLKNGSTPTYTKSLSSSNASDLLMPNDTCAHIYEKMEECSPIRALASTIKISTDSLEMLLDNKYPETAWSSEVKFPAEIKDPEFKKIKIPVYEIFSRIKVTQKLIEDSNIDIYNWFVTRVAEQIANIEDVAFLFGDGDGKPKGILSYPTDDICEFGKFQHFKTGKQGGFGENGADILISAVAALRRKFLKNATWVMSRSAFSAIQQLRINDDGKYVWRPSLSQDRATLLGYPIVIDENMPELNASNPTNSIMFGDFSRAYQIVDRKDVNIFRDPYSSKPFVEFYSTKRTGGDVVNFDALKVIRFE